MATEHALHAHEAVVGEQFGAVAGKRVLGRHDLVQGARAHGESDAVKRRSSGPMMSKGSGNTMVEFLSAAITVSVSR